MTTPTAPVANPPAGRSPTGDVGHGATTPYGFGLLVGAVFGLIDVVANAGVALPSPASTVLRALGVAAFVGLLLVMRRTRQAPPTSATGRMGFGPGYWLIVAAEVAAIAVGTAVLNGPVGAPFAVVAWISVVVGVHFFALAALWRVPFLRGPGAAIALCGAVGLVAAGAGSSAAAIAAIAGLAPGAVLLGGAYWGAAAHGVR